ncbi:MAG: Fe-S cluster assembly protein SufD [Myxococcales bacterium]
MRTSFAARRERSPGDSLPALRDAAFARFVELGLPTAADESWKYTSLGPLAQLPFEAPVPGPARASEEQLVRAWGAPESVQLVFVDGRHRPELSSPASGSGGVFLGSLRAALAKRPELVGAELARHADFRRDALTALNTAFIDDGAFIHLPADSVVEAPIHLLFISTPDGKTTLSQPRNLIVAGARSRATVIETYAGPPDGVYLTNAVTEISLGEGARVEHYKLQQESARAFHIALLQVTQGRESGFRSHSLALGGALARNEVRAVFAAEGGECALNGLYMASGKQHLDNRTLIDHKNPRCTSRELYKGVLDGESHGVFGGRVLVREDAQKTDARQINRNLLLSPGALIDTKPQLEIFADDVKCAHGAAVGELDADALFYLRSRGLGLDAARSLLTWAFAGEMVELIPLLPLRARVRDLVTARLPDGGSLREAA